MAVVVDEQADLAALTRFQLEDKLAQLASHIYAGTCRWLELVAELDRRCQFVDYGCGSAAEWIAWRCGLTPRSAREHVRVARRLGELPLLHDAFSRGQLSYAKLRPLTRVANEDSEQELLELARHLTAAQLERALRAYSMVTAAEAADLQALAYLGWDWAEDGSLVIRGRLAPEEGALFLRALEAARDLLREQAWQEERGSAEPRAAAENGSAEPPAATTGPTNVEAFVAMADRSLAASERSGGERYQVVVHVEAEALAGADERDCQLEDGPALAAETARRLACDCSLVEITEGDWEPLSVGRKTRKVPPALRRALRARDRSCRFPGCDNRRFLDGHHVQHWAQGGATKLDNLLLLCRRHHQFVHEGGYRVTLRPDGAVRFHDRWGCPLPAVPRPPPGDADELLRRNRHVPIDGDTCAGGDGDRMELRWAVDALLGVLGSRDREGDP